MNPTNLGKGRGLFSLAVWAESLEFSLGSVGTVIQKMKLRAADVEHYRL